LIITCLWRSLCLFDGSNLQSLPINIQLSKTSNIRNRTASSARMRIEH